MTPLRVFDSRDGTGPIPGGCTAVVALQSTLPPQATAVGLEIIAVNATDNGWITAYPCGGPRPFASNVNPQEGDVNSNLVVSPLPSTGNVCVFTSVTTDLVIDVEGWFGPAGLSFHGVSPARVLDTRTSLRPDGGTGPLEADTVVEIPIAGLGSVPAGAGAIAVNLTVVDTGSSGWLTAYPCSATRPLASHGNYLAGDVRASQTIVGLDGGGRLCVYTSAMTDLIVDVSGWFGGTDGVRLVPMTETRVLDTRSATNGPPAPIVAGQVFAFDASLGGTVPVGASTVLDVVVTQAAGPGYLTFYPCDAPLPPTSTVNVMFGGEATNAAVVPVGTSGLVCVFSSVTTHLVVDVLGSFGPAGALRGLDVSPGPLTPAFSPDAHDYGVICSPGTNQWTVSANSVPNATVNIGGADSNGNVMTSENSAVVVSVTEASGSTEEYWIRCLPSDFPVFTIDRPDDPGPGWYLLATGFTGGATYAVILDEHGAVVWYHKTPAVVINFERLSNGDLAWTQLLGQAFGTNPDGAYEEHAIDGSLVHLWQTVGSPTDQHEFVLLPNGNGLLGTYPVRTGVDVSALGPGFTSPASVVDAVIQEIRPDGSLAWEWRSEDHIAVAETEAQRDGVPIVFNIPAGKVIDLIHLNSLDFDAASGDVIMSARHLDAVLRIRRNPGQPDDGKVLWKLGGNAPTDPATLHFTLVNDPVGGPARQHDARLVAGGFLTMFDDQSGRPASSPSRGVEYLLNPGAGTATLVWQYPHPDGAQAQALGSTRDQSDGSVVIGWGAVPPLFTEVGPSGNLVLQLDQVPPGIGYRVIKEPPASFSRDVLHTKAGL
ncbi:MAG TPA: aryl-sulfate sulfotransferase [Candidatus Methylomirabilis sp.]|nr:aryl-sulfate sulfotransferase [Candidatus Methylomirabilis sp.]